jgi:mRNA-degrading endonuclease RelE of RelBE toxin-antitoxin system
MPDQEWKVDFESNSTEKEYKKFFKDHADQRPCQTNFERDVKTNPLYHPKDRRIRKMKGEEYKGLYRWKESNTKVIYFPQAPQKTVFVVETGTATGISYKKKSSK